jgi:hypothetical protein
MRKGAQQLEGPMAGRVFLDQADLKRRGIVFSNVHLRRLEARGMFPKRIMLGTGRSIAWDEREITEWQNQRLERRVRLDRGGGAPPMTSSG